ncbi:MAG: XdhC family protein [Novosphingobium sp.]
MTAPHSILRFLTAENATGQRTALIILTGIEGSAARGIGTLMGVSERGAYQGSISGGCVEPALVGEAQRVMAAGRTESLRIGTGSPLIDIRLPCGSGLDLLIVPLPQDGRAVAQAVAALSARNTATLIFSRDGELALMDAPTATGWQADRFALHLRPPLRLVLAGHGEEVTALAALGSAWGAEVMILSPEQRILDACAGMGETQLLKSASNPPALTLDPWSALVMLFHDHDWETALLAAAVSQPALFIGAMGSRATQASRLETLTAAGVSAGNLARITGPIGLIPAARDPQTLALSVLAQVVAAYGPQPDSHAT